MATPPVKRSVLWPLLWLLALLVICGGLRAVVQEEQRMGAQVTTVRRSALVPRRGGMVRAPVAAPASAKTDFPWGQVEQVVTLMLWVGRWPGWRCCCGRCGSTGGCTPSGWQDGAPRFCAAGAGRCFSRSDAYQVL